MGSEEEEGEEEQEEKSWWDIGVETVSGWFGDVTDSVSGGLDSLKEFFEGLISGLIDKLSSFIVGILESLQDIFNIQERLSDAQKEDITERMFIEFTTYLFMGTLQIIALIMIIRIWILINDAVPII